jgi:hypothetical protein
MPCVIWEITHVDLHRHHSDDAPRGVPDGEQDGENELHGHIEHAALDDDSYYGLSRPAVNCAIRMSRTLRGERHQMRMAIRVVKITFVINGRMKPAKPSGTTEAGAIAVRGETFNKDGWPARGHC